MPYEKNNGKAAWWRARQGFATYMSCFQAALNMIYSNKTDTTNSNCYQIFGSNLV